ncbi:MAG: quinol:cytochrome C oxidoreductase, partial [Spirochaetia bacterium]|nr:quinol:cytochrome C oxidoreductase [Spirochaetia bacterium]
LITVLVHFLNRDGLLRGHLTTAHFYDLGKMLYVFNLFWAYIAFLQYLLVWYANLPEETSFYHIRSAQGWSGMVLVLIFGHLLIPTLFFMSRHAKMNLRVNLLMSLWILLMHGVDIYFIVLPNFHPTFTYFRPAEALALLGVGSLYLGFFLFYLGRAPLVPIGDPRLGESLAHGRNP